MKTILLILLLTGSIMLAPMLSAQEAPRPWTDQKGRVIQATLVDATSSSVKVKLATGMLTDIPMGNLSEADQTYVKDWLKAKAGVPSGDKGAAPPPASATAAAPWPDKVALKAPPKVTVVKEDAAAKEYIYRTEHFEFKSPAPLGASVVKEISTLFEVSHLAATTFPVGLKPAPEGGQQFFACQFYATREDYVAAGGTQGSPASYGGGRIFMPFSAIGIKMFGKKLVVEEGVENGTLKHHTMLILMNRWHNKVPVWVSEGFAEYMTMAALDHGAFNFKPREKLLDLYARRRGGKPLLPMPRLKKFLSLTGDKWSEPDQRAASMNFRTAGYLAFYFFHLDGKGDAAGMAAYLNAIDTGAMAEKAFEEHLLRGRTLEQLEEEIDRSLRKLGCKVEWMDSTGGG